MPENHSIRTVFMLLPTQRFFDIKHDGLVGLQGRAGILIKRKIRQNTATYSIFWRLWH